jgi:hypothetical protein
MGILDDDSLDTRAKAIIQKKRTATSELLSRAAMIEESPSPAMLEDTAQWIAATDELAAAGFTPEQILRLALRATKDRFGLFPPDNSMLAHLFAIDAGLAIARSVCDEILAKNASPLEWEDQRLASAALARLAKDRAIEARFDVLFEWEHDPTELRAIIGALPPDRREALVTARAVPDTGEDVDTARNAAYIVDKLLWIADLVPSVRERFATLLSVAAGDDEHDRLAKEVASNTQRTIEPRPTQEARDALKYWDHTIATANRAADIHHVARDVYARSIVVDAPELSTVASWSKAGAKRQKQIAVAVAKAVSEHAGKACKVVDIVSYGGPPIATLALGKQRFCLVPGGAFEMGFSEEEEAAVRANAEVNAGCGNHWELYEQLFEQVHAMRPITHVRVGPMLVEQGRGEVFELDEATDVLDKSPFRVPSEAEWEYCARGGKQRELTYRGDVVPDHEEWFEATAKLGVKGANHFGLHGFGFEPELCADAWHETLDDHPVDGSPRKGDGERVVRGGAAQLYPWQATGEWHMLLSAFRMPSSASEFSIAMRFVLGIQCGAKRD